MGELNIRADLERKRHKFISLDDLVNAIEAQQQVTTEEVVRWLYDNALEMPAIKRLTPPSNIVDSSILSLAEKNLYTITLRKTLEPFFYQSNWHIILFIQLQADLAGLWF